jgi:hypothetical protein
MNSRSLEYNVVQMRKPVLYQSSTESEGIHETRGENGRVPRVAEAQGALQGSEKFYTEGTGANASVYCLYLVFEERANERGDGKGDPVEQGRKDLEEGRGGVNA